LGILLSMYVGLRVQQPAFCGSCQISIKLEFSQKIFKKSFYILLTVHLDVILVNDQLDALFLNVFISCLYMFRATSAHHQEDQLVFIHHLV
jgi:hypothetical protein